MNRAYLNAGAQYTDTDAKKDALAIAISKMEWVDYKRGDKISLPFMQGFAINQLILQCGNKVDRVGHGMYKDGLAILAIRNNYTNGEVKRATLYSIDDGCDVLTNIIVDTETEILQHG